MSQKSAQWEHVTFEGNQKVIALGKRQELMWQQVRKFLGLKKLFLQN